MEQPLSKKYRCISLQPTAHPPTYKQHCHCLQSSFVQHRWRTVEWRVIRYVSHSVSRAAATKTELMPRGRERIHGPPYKINVCKKWRHRVGTRRPPPLVVCSQFIAPRCAGWLAGSTTLPCRAEKERQGKRTPHRKKAHGRTRQLVRP